MIELAALVASHAIELIESDDPLPEEAVDRYWSASHRRRNRWIGSLRRYASRDERDAGASASETWPETRRVLEEIFSAEVLVRVWCAALTAGDRRRGTRDVEPLARSVLRGQSEARHSALSLLVQQAQVDLDEAAAVDRFRRRTERWADLLLAPLAERYGLTEFACNAARVVEFAEEFSSRHGPDRRSAVWPLVHGSLQRSFQEDDGPAPNRALNREIGQAIVECFPAAFFRPRGPASSLTACGL